MLLYDLEGHIGGGPLSAEHRSPADPQWEGHGVPQSVGEEQLGRREADVVLDHSQRVYGVMDAGGGDVAVPVHGALGPPRRT